MEEKSVTLHSSLMPLLAEIADDMRNVTDYTVDIQPTMERIVVTWVSCIGDKVVEVWNF